LPERRQWARPAGAPRVLQQRRVVHVRLLLGCKPELLADAGRDVASPRPVLERNPEGVVAGQGEGRQRLRRPDPRRRADHADMLRASARLRRRRPHTSHLTPRTSTPIGAAAPRGRTPPRILPSPRIPPPGPLSAAPAATPA